MLVTELRGKLLTKMEEAAASGDEVGAALVCAYARAMLVALVSHAEDAEVEPQNLEVGTGTAAVILGLHPEYVPVPGPPGWTSGYKTERRASHTALSGRGFYGRWSKVAFRRDAGKIARSWGARGRMVERIAWPGTGLSLASRLQMPAQQVEGGLAASRLLRSRLA